MPLDLATEDLLPALAHQGYAPDRPAAVVRMGGPTGIWRFGLVPEAVDPLLHEYGWTALEDAGPAEYAQRYPQLRRRTLVVSEIERCVHAGRS